LKLVFNPFLGRFDFVSSKATEISIADSGNYYTGTNVELALQEIADGTTLDGRYVNVTGDTMTGALTVYNGTDAIKSGAGYPIYRKSYNSASYTEPTLDDYGTMAFYYKMNEGSGTTLNDETANNNDATLAIGQTSGAVPTWTTDPNGTANQAVDFITGKAYVTSAWRPTSSFTVCTVMKFDDLFTSTAGKYSQIFANWKYVKSNDKNGFSLRYQYNGDNNLSFYITNGGATEATATVSHTSAGLNTTNWFHIACRFDDANNEISIWVNGVKKAYTTYSTTVGYIGTEIFTIGALGTPYTTADSVNYCGDFKMNWVAAYSEALTDLEIYNQAVTTLGLGFTADVSDTNASVATAGRLRSWKSAGVEKAYLNGDGAIYTPTILDSNGNEAIKIVTTASAVNELTVTPGATGSGITLSATGDDTNISFAISSKGTGATLFGGTSQITASLANPVVEVQHSSAGRNGLAIVNTDAVAADISANIAFYNRYNNNPAYARSGLIGVFRENATLGNSSSYFSLYLNANGGTNTIAERLRVSSAGDLRLMVSGASILDLNGNELIKTSATASAVNEFTITNAATGGSPTLSATGTDTNIDLAIVPKGSGQVETNNLKITGGGSFPAWTTNGIGFSAAAATYTDTTSSGTVASAGVYAFGQPTIAASSSTTITDGATWYIAGGPANGTNTTVTNSWGLWNVGKTRLDGSSQFGTASTDTFTFTGRMIVRSVTDAGPMTNTNGTQSEIVFNTSDSKFYGCTITGTPATWAALN